MFKSKLKWDFPLKKHMSGKEQRKANVLNELAEIRAERDVDKTYKKLRDTALKKFGHMRSSLGFSGAAMLGITAEDDSQRPGAHTQPQGFMMQKQQDQNQSLNSTMYDDTGRGLRTMEVQRLLDKAKQVIARDNRKEHKLLLKKTGQLQAPSFDNKTYKVSKTAQNTKNQFGLNNTGMTGGGTFKLPGASIMDSEEDEDKEEARARQRKIPPFSFDIDDDIDDAVLINQQVYDDLRQLKDLLGDQESGAGAALNLGKSKRKKK